MRAAHLKMATPSVFAGISSPKLPLAIALRPIRAGQTGKGRQAAQVPAMSRYEARPLAHGPLGTPRRSAGMLVTLSGRRLPPQRVAVVAKRRRPAAIPKGARWIHVDLKQQTLVAYEGDRPVRATLVSTGKPGTATRAGLYRGISKVRLSDMRGRTPEPYVAEAVRHVQHFWLGQALHGAWWHDGFGAVRSHGCINLAPADARWLFAWAPPPLPEGWRGILPAAADPALYVLIEKRTPTGPVAAPELKLDNDRRCIDRGADAAGLECPFDALEGAPK